MVKTALVTGANKGIGYAIANNCWSRAIPFWLALAMLVAVKQLYVSCKR